METVDRRHSIYTSRGYWFTLLVAVVAPSTAAAVSWVLQGGTAAKIPLYNAFVFAVAVSAVLGGLRCGLLSLGFSLLYIRIIFFAKFFSSVGGRSAHLSYFAFIIVGLMLSLLLGDLRQKHLALQRSERRYRTLFESIDEGFCVVEILFGGGEAIDFRYLEANPAAEKHIAVSTAVIGHCKRSKSPY